MVRPHYISSKISLHFLRFFRQNLFAIETTGFRYWAMYREYRGIIRSMEIGSWENSYHFPKWSRIPMIRYEFEDWIFSKGEGLSLVIKN